MALRKYTNPREYDVSRGLQDVLRRNGMQAHISMNQNGEYYLIALGHDSPVMKYKLTDRQVENLMNWGSNYANKTAYNTFTSIVRNDFDMPDNFVSARNAFGRVAMGLHGYRLGRGEYGVPSWRPFSRMSRGWGGDFLGWGPRGGGWHMRRIDGRTFMADGPMVPTRPDGRVKPGELNAGGYGFYYKGHQQQTSQDVLDDLAIEQQIKPKEAAPRPKGQAKPLSEEMGNHLYFNDGFQEVLRSHGIIIDAEKKTLTIQSANTKVDLEYCLTDEEVQRLTALQEKGKGGVTLQQRLDIINNVIKGDFATNGGTEDSYSISVKTDKGVVNVPVVEEMYEEYINHPEDRVSILSTVLAGEYQRQPSVKVSEQDFQKALQSGVLQVTIDGTAMNIPIDSDLMKEQQLELQETGYDNSYIQQILAEANVDSLRKETESVKKYFDIKGLSQEYDTFSKVMERYPLNELTLNGEKANILSSEAKVEKGKPVIGPVTRDMLESKELISIALKPEVREEVEAEFIAYDRMVAQQKEMAAVREQQRQKNLAIAADPNAVNGKDIQALLGKKGWFQPVEHGRQMVVGEIRVDKTAGEHYIMSAVINGEKVTHGISEKDYRKFLDLDDEHRLKLFDKTFKEVKIKSSDGWNDEDGVYMQHSEGQKTYVSAEQLAVKDARNNSVDGAALQELNQKKGFYREAAHGREVEVGKIEVNPTAEGKYKMTAVINGESISHEITQKDYDKFMAVDDYHRMKLFSKVFNEVDMKTRPGEGANIGAAILAALVVAGEVLTDGLGRGPRPDVFLDRHFDREPIYHKPGVVSPGEVAAARFEGLDFHQGMEVSEGRGRGM